MKSIRYRGFRYVASDKPQRWQDGKWNCTTSDPGMGGDPTICLTVDGIYYCIVLDPTEKTVSLQITNDNGDELGHDTVKATSWLRPSVSAAITKLIMRNTFTPETGSVRLQAPPKSCLSKMWSLFPDWGV